MNVLITGASGFIGSVLARYCAAVGHVVLGIGKQNPSEIAAGVLFETCDVRDLAQLSKIINSFRPDRIFHLAAQSYPTVSLVKPQETFATNALGTINLFESLRSARLSPVTIVACSSAEYGTVAESRLPVQEGHPLCPLHPYGVSKVAQDLLAFQYFANFSIPAIRIRIFNTTGPGKLRDICSDLTKRAVEIESGRSMPVLIAGDLTTKRALLDVRDVVHALWLASDCCTPGDVYNLGGAQIYSGYDLVEIVRQRVRTPFDIVQEPRLVRTCDQPVVWGDTSKFRACTGWTPAINIVTTVQDMLEWWRRRLE